MALVKKQAACIVPDKEAVEKVFPEIDHLLAQPEMMERMRQNMLQLGISDSAIRVADEIINVIKK